MLTREEIMRLVAGDFMDAEVCKVMLAEDTESKLPGWFGDSKPSKGLVAAWMVFESLPPKMFGHELSLGRVGDQWGVYYGGGENRDIFVSLEPTVFMAICRAKLLLVLDGEEKREGGEG